MCISSQVEMQTPSAILSNSEVASVDSSRSLLNEQQSQQQTSTYSTIVIPYHDEIPSSSSSSSLAPTLPIFTPEFRLFILKLSLAITPDYIGSGLAQITWMTYFFKREYSIAEGPLGLAIFTALLLSSFLNLLSSPLSRALGQVPTMVLCHTITSISLLLITAPSNRTLALRLFMLRIVLREIDAALR